LVREQLLGKGWRRHSIISDEDGSLNKVIAHLPEKIQQKASADGAIILISTYDCAVVNHCFDTEPWVQLLIAFPVDYAKKYSKGRDPRRLHFSITHAGQEKHFETNASCICQCAREILLDVDPDENYQLSDIDKYDLKTWVAERFRQDTWPDALNRALKPAEGRLKRFYRRYNEYASGMYLRLNTYEELEGKKYSASVILALESGKQRALIKKLKTNNPQLNGKTIDEVMSHLANEVLTSFGDTIIIDSDPTNNSGKAIEIMEESNISVQQLREFACLSPHSLSDFNADEPPPIETVPGKHF